ncbi:hypothetical protein [Verrucosispora sioxanthis]|uniref:hypothetical protein n=1 Tax=Verrucosispora sioxanthis TaxID=2499994 RepID=UPI001AA05B1B|nr:hypothetical protein [Verrucosispora sioxanthis]
MALAAETTDDLSQTESESSGGSPVMYFGIAMVAAGALLIGLLIYRSRKDRKDRGRPADGFETLPPRSPGGTTYRSGGGQGVAPVAPVAPVPPGPGTVPPVPPAQAYGAGRPATPRVYGGAPAPRPTGGLYGARPADPSDGPPAAPPAGRPTGPIAVPPVEPGQGRVPGHPDGSPGAGKGDEPEYGRGLGG